MLGYIHVHVLQGRIDRGKGGGHGGSCLPSRAGYLIASCIILLCLVKQLPLVQMNLDLSTKCSYKSICKVKKSGSIDIRTRLFVVIVCSNDVGVAKVFTCNYLLYHIAGKFGGELNLVVDVTTAKLKSTKISYSPIYVWWILYWTAKSKSANIFAIAILGSTAKFNSFRLYSMTPLDILDPPSFVRVRYMYMCPMQALGYAYGSTT